MKPCVESKMEEQIKVSRSVYEDLQHFYQNVASVDEELRSARKQSYASEGSPNFKMGMSMQ
jgi:hypothetical protein